MKDLYQLAYAQARHIEPQAMPTRLLELVHGLITLWTEQGERR